MAKDKRDKIMDQLREHEKALQALEGSLAKVDEQRKEIKKRIDIEYKRIRNLIRDKQGPLFDTEEEEQKKEELPPKAPKKKAKKKRK
jgi:hypothetical protein